MENTILKAVSCRLQRLRTAGILLLMLMLSSMAVIAQPVTFNYTGGQQTYTVPSGATSLTVDVQGARGGPNNNGSNGGLGGRTQATIAVTPGQVIYIYVGGAGSVGPNAPGGFNGGGMSGGRDWTGSGGGASDIRIGGTALGNRVVVAGGGAGPGLNCGAAGGHDGGAGGGLIGGTGWQCNQQTNYVGLGGTQSAGGAMGNNQSQGCGTNGSLGVGGTGACTFGGGGGGGYYGGGGGGYGGGGGGSSFTSGTLIAHTQGFRAGNGVIVITPNITSPCATPTSVTASPNTICAGASTNLTATSTGNTINWYTVSSGGAPIGTSASGGNLAITPGATTTYWAEAVGACPASARVAVTVTVIPTNTLSGPSSNPTVCKNTALTNITFTSTGATGIGTPSGLPAGVTASFGANTLTISGTPTVAGTYNYTIPLTGGCGAMTAAGTITVRDLTAFAGPDVFVQLGNGIAIGGAPSATGGSGPGTYTYAWSPSANLSSATVANPTASPTAQTTYTLTVTDTTGCTAVDSAIVRVTNCTYAIVLTGIDPITHGGSEGSVAATLVGATGPATYSWSNGATTATISNLAAGTYVVTVTAGGCSDTASVLLHDAPPPVITCLGETLTFVPDLAGATYYWTFGDGASSGLQSPTHTYGSTGTYLVTLVVTSSTLCTSTSYHQVTVNQVVLTMTHTDAECDLIPTGTATAAANGGVAPYTYLWSNGQTTATITGLAPGTYTVTATDSVGCTAIDTVVILSLDLAAPMISCPPSLAAQCNISQVPAYVDFAAFQADGGTATDAHLAVGTFTLVSQTTDGMSCPETVTRVYSIADSCGHVSTCSQLIIINDTTAPVLDTPPANQTVACDNVPAAAVLNATDNCTTPVVTVNDLTTAGNCNGNYVITRTWTATDACGNTSTATQTITVQDLVAPVITLCPADVSIACGANTAPGATGTATATDNCGIPTVTHADASNLTGCYNSGTITRTWTATDACGNTATCVQVITVNPPAPATFSAVSNITVQGCTAPAATSLSYSNGLTGGCEISGSVVGVVTGSQGTCGGSYTETWTFVDACGRTSLQSRTISNQDTTPPVLNCPPAIVLLANGPLPAGYASFGDFVTAGGSATDNCGLNPGSLAVVSTTGGPLNFVRTYTIADYCGNTATCTQAISMPPALIVVVVTSVPCDGIANGEATASASGGVGPYSYLWSNGQTTNPATGLAPGSYTVTVTDANGTVVTGNVIVTSQAPVNSGFQINR